MDIQKGSLKLPMTLAHVKPASFLSIIFLPGPRVTALIIYAKNVLLWFFLDSITVGAASVGLWRLMQIMFKSVSPDFCLSRQVSADYSDCISSARCIVELFPKTENCELCGLFRLPTADGAERLIWFQTLVWTDIGFWRHLSSISFRHSSNKHFDPVTIVLCLQFRNTLKAKKM